MERQITLTWDWKRRIGLLLVYDDDDDSNDDDSELPCSSFLLYLSQSIFLISRYTEFYVAVYRLFLPTGIRRQHTRGSMDAETKAIRAKNFSKGNA